MKSIKSQKRKEGEKKKKNQGMHNSSDNFHPHSDGGPFSHTVNCQSAKTAGAIIEGFDAN